MADVKHTLGPWLIREWPDPFVTIVSEHPPASDPRDASGTEICRVINLGNARLLAAAPDLLEALDGLMELERRGRLMPIGAEWDKARAAIAKATGAARATEGSAT